MSNRKLIKIPSCNLGRQSPKNDITALENKHITLPETMFTYDLNILETYLPKMMNKDEVAKIAKIKKEEFGVNDVKEKGKLMQALMKELKGQADGNLVKEVVDRLFV
jgi:Glu-tRNA(Gln) amidotransferase subunit E-like FAD-binding protein